MPTVASVPCSARTIRCDNCAASAGWSVEVQMPAPAAAGAPAVVLAGLGVLAGAAVRAGAAVLAGAGVLARAGALAGAGASAEPRISRAESTRAYAGHQPLRRIVITLLRQRTTVGSQAGVT